MCGRFTLATPTEVLVELFEIAATPLPDLPPRYNIAPTQRVAAVRTAAEDGVREMVLLRWGLIPSWARDPGIGSRLINARSETVGEKPAYRGAFRQRRCLVPADGFYEWKKEGAGKQPYLFRLEDGRAFGMAGLWERWRSGEGEVVETCTILTTDASEVVRAVHPRMPVILPRADHAAWLDPAVDDTATLASMLRPYQDRDLVGYGVGRGVNAPGSEGPALIQPVD